MWIFKPENSGNEKELRPTDTTVGDGTTPGSKAARGSEEEEQGRMTECNAVAIDGREVCMI